MRRELAAKRHRRASLKVGQRIVGKGAELVVREILRVCLVAKLGRELQTMLVVLAEPGELVHVVDRRGARAGVHVRAAAEGHHSDTRRPVIERRVQSHVAAG